ncbi:acyltransferase family protein [Croceitalea marina]|uniref:Acyltransferase family protein n=1 Tax=Croceitalea marina TaxID=1775166 RepID=A0ABW5N111_9FLAO
MWFLGNILIYTFVFLLLFLFLKKIEDQPLGLRIKRFIGSVWGILTLAILYILESFIVNPGNFELYAETWHGFFLGLISFLFGFLFIYSGKVFWKMICAKRWLFLILGFAFYGVRLFYFELQTPNFLKGIESIAWILALFGFGFKHLNKPSILLAYLSQSAYPVYIIHMAVLYLVSKFIFPLDISAIAKFVASLLITVLSSLFIYEFVIRRITLFRIVFGLKKKNKDEKNLPPYSKNQSIYEYGG